MPAPIEEVGASVGAGVALPVEGLVPEGEGLAGARLEPLGGVPAPVGNSEEAVPDGGVVVLGGVGFKPSAKGARVPA